jgi:hypothetical protein
MVAAGPSPTPNFAHLYMSGNHFGAKGQAIIAKEILAKLK